jgi:short subunit dehydrogenase-like uncharacterized protein
VAAAQRELDIVLYGATGFVGKLTAEYLARAGAETRIGLAGRSADRLQAIRDTLGPAAQQWPLIVADASQPSTLDAMAAKTQVVVTTVGPYTRYGLPLVEACARAGTDYADLTGEAMFVRNSIDLYHKQAVDTGARIVHSCGFDSIPSDLSVYQLYRRVTDDGAAELGPQPDFAWRRGRQIAPELAGIWTGAFVMASHNSRIVRRSNALQDWAYGKRFRYSETMSLGSSAVAPVTSAMATGGLAATFALASRYFRLLPQRLVERIAPKPGTGPSEASRERGHYTIETYTTTTTGARYMATFGQQGDPGYKATSVLLGESGLALALDRDRLSDLRGVLTPAAAMGDALLTRLPTAGVSMGTDRLH